MTIIEAIKTVLADHPEGLSANSVYEEIIKRQLYVFKAKNPAGVVNGEIRRHCFGLDFPTSNPVKHFKVVGSNGKNFCFH